MIVNLNSHPLLTVLVHRYVTQIRPVALCIIMFSIGSSVRAQIASAPSTQISLSANYSPTAPPVMSATVADNTQYTVTSTPACTGYNIYVTAGTAYASTTQTTAGGATFTVIFQPNVNSIPRNAVVRVVDKCSGSFADFIFTQTGGTGCGANVQSPSGSGTWLFRAFQCYNLGVIDTSLNPMTANQGLHGAKYMFGANTVAVNQVDDQNTYGLDATPVTGWTTLYYQSDNQAWRADHNPCPIGYRVPTESEWADVADPTHNVYTPTGTWTSSGTNSATDYTSGANFGGNLFLPATGWREETDGKISQRGYVGIYWSSTADINSAYTMDVYGPGNTNGDITGIYLNSYERGFSVRCISQ